MNVGCVSRGRAHQTAIQEYVGLVFCGVLIYFVDKMVFYASVKDDILALLL